MYTVGLVDRSHTVTIEEALTKRITQRSTIVKEKSVLQSRPPLQSKNSLRLESEL